jgi:hypothetical protein
MLITLASQTAVALIVVAIYHAWFSTRRRSSQNSAETDHAGLGGTPTTRILPQVNPGRRSTSEPGVISAALVAKSADTLEGEIAAVIAAAVATVLDGPLKILHVQQVTAPIPAYLNVWAYEGRLQIFTSHKVR